MNRTPWKWQILEWHEMCSRRSTIASRITGKLNCPSNGWQLRVCRPRSSPPSQTWWDTKMKYNVWITIRIFVCCNEFILFLSFTVVVFRGPDVGDAHKRGQPVSWSWPLWCHTLSLKGTAAASAAILSRSIVSFKESVSLGKLSFKHNTFAVLGFCEIASGLLRL